MACRILTRMVLHFCRVGRAGKGSRRPKMRRRSWQKWKNSRNIKRLSYNRIPQKCAKSSLNRVQFETRSTNLPRSPRGGEDLNWNLRVSNWTRFRSCAWLPACACCRCSNTAGRTDAGPLAEQVAVDHERPDQVVGAQHVEGRRHRRSFEIALFGHRLL